MYNVLQVHVDGYISLQTTQAGTQQSGSGVSDIYYSKENITTLFSSSDPLIGVFVTDVDTTGVGDIYYQYVCTIK